MMFVPSFLALFLGKSEERGGKGWERARKAKNSTVMYIL
jgi:hypothetical protein